MQVDEVVDDFLIYKGLIEAPKKRGDSIVPAESAQAISRESADPHTQKRAFRRGKNYEMEKLLATVEVLSIKI